MRVDREVHLMEPPIAASALPQAVSSSSQPSLLRRTIELWPYALLLISVTGLTYLALTPPR